LVGAVLTTANGYGNITYTLQSGAPNTPVVSYPAASYTTSLQAQQNMQITGLAVGTYIWQVKGSDKVGGVVLGYDTLVVTAAVPTCPSIPSPSYRITGWTVVQVGGISRIQVTYWDGAIGLLP